MQANRNMLDRIRQLAKAAGVRPGELLAMAREAEHHELMPSLEHLSSDGARQLLTDLERLQADRHWLMEAISSATPTETR